MAESLSKYCAFPSSEDQLEGYDSTGNVNEDGVGASGVERAYSTSQAESQTKWTYFLLGCATLLPFHGDIRQITRPV